MTTGVVLGGVAAIAAPAGAGSRVASLKAAVRPPVTTAPSSTTTTVKPKPAATVAPVTTAPSTTITGKPAPVPTTTAPGKPSTTTTAPAAAPVPAPAATVAAPAGVVVRNGTSLARDGKPYAWAGVAAPQAATYWPVNWGCGTMQGDDDLDAMFASMPAGTIVSVWATQAMAFNNKTTKAIDFTGIDRVVAAAQRHGQLLDFVIGTQQGYCSDGHFKDRAWYAGGYRQAFNDDGRGLEPLSYWDWVHAVVPRYAPSGAVAAWTLVSEPEASNCGAGFKGADCYPHLSCPADASAVLRSFFDVVGGEVKRLDARHLVSSGTIGGGQCGTAGDQFTTVHQSPAIDICELRDYSGGATMPAGMQAMIDRCHAAGKAAVIGELGLNGGSGSNCSSLTQRRSQLTGKLNAAFAQGLSGVVLWQWGSSPSSCGYELAQGDPALGLLGPR